MNTSGALVTATSNGTGQLTYSFTSVAGGSVIGHARWVGNASAITSATCTGNTVNLIGSPTYAANVNETVQFFSIDNLAANGAASVVIQISNQGSNNDGELQVYTGGNTSGFYEAGTLVSATGNSAGPLTVNVVTAGDNSAMYAVGVSDYGGTPTADTAGGWSQITSGNNFDGYGGGAQKADVGAAGTKTVNLTTVGSSQWFIVAVALLNGTPTPTITSADGDNIVVDGQSNVAIVGTNLTGATFDLVDGSITSAQNVDSTSSASAQIDIALGNCRYGVRTIRATTGAGNGSRSVTINPPTGKAYLTLTSPNSTAANRITAVSDLAAGYQLEISNVVGGTISDVNVNTDGTFDVAQTVVSFDARAHDGTAWGTVGTQQIIGAIVWRTDRGNGRIISSRWLGGGF